MVVETGQRIRLGLVLEPRADLGVVERERRCIAEPLRELELVVVEGRVLAQPVDVQSTLDRLARDQRNRDHRLRLVVRRAGDCLGARIEMRLVHSHRLAVLDAPAGEPDTERTLVSEDLVRPFVARPDGGEHAPRLVGRVDRQRVVGNEICERIRNAVEQRIEALLGQDVMEDVREPAVRLDERSLTGRGGRRSSRLGNEAQRYRVIAHRRRPFGW